MKLYHVSPARNTTAILRAGLDPAFATGNRTAVWYVTASRLPWAVRHVMRRNRTTAVTVFAVEVPRAALRRFSLRGVWYSAIVAHQLTKLRMPCTPAT